MTWRFIGVGTQWRGDLVAYGSNDVGIMWHVDSMVSGHVACGSACVRARAIWILLGSGVSLSVAYCFTLCKRPLLYYFKFTVLLNSLLKSEVHAE